MEPVYRAVHHISIKSEQEQKEDILITESVLLKEHSYGSSHLYIFLKAKPIIGIFDPYSYIILLTKQERLTCLETVNGFSKIISRLVAENWPRDTILQIALDIVSYAQKANDDKIIKEIIEGLKEYNIAKHIK